MECNKIHRLSVSDMFFFGKRTVLSYRKHRRYLPKHGAAFGSSHCPLAVEDEWTERDEVQKDLNGMSFECHKLADDQIPENVLKPSAQQNEIAETYPFVRPLHEQVTALSSVSMEFNSVRSQDSPTMQLFDTRYFPFPL